MPKNIIDTPLIPIWQAHYNVRIKRNMMSDVSYSWSAWADANIGMQSYITPNANGMQYRTPEEAVKGWEEFAQANLISSYHISMPS